VLSIAYQYSGANRPAIEDEYAKVREENDWTSQQVALYPERLRGFCSVNPLKDYAIGEIERCSRDPQLHYGLKLHFGNSDVDLDNPVHVEKLQQVFHRANQHQMAMVVHMRASITKKRPYGRKQAGIFLRDVLPAAPDVPVQIAHLAGAGVMTTHRLMRRSAFSSTPSAKTTRAWHMYISMFRESPGTGNGKRKRN